MKNTGGLNDKFHPGPNELQSWKALGLERSDYSQSTHKGFLDGK